MDLRKLTVGERVKSFRYALHGLWIVFCNEPNTWYMAVCSIATVAAGFYFRVTRIEWCFLATAITLVWLAEVINSAIEYLTDLASPEQHPLAQRAKDAAAGAALLAVLFSLVIAALVFGPRILGHWR